MTPNKEAIRKWVDALRSGEYAQGRGSLCYQDMDGSRSYCCLGVASQLAAQEGLVPVTLPPDTYGDIRYGGATSYLDTRVSEWLGIEGIDPAVEVHGGCTALSDLNDTERMDFNQIADVIEENFLK